MNRLGDHKLLLSEGSFLASSHWDFKWNKRINTLLMAKPAGIMS